MDLDGKFRVVWLAPEAIETFLGVPFLCGGPRQLALENLALRH
jgi:hypothetical protein